MSVYSQFYTELFPPKPAFEESDFPDQSGRVIIVTGGNTGIGKATCEVLLRKNAKVYLAARSEEKATEAIADLKQKTGKTGCHYLHLDLADLTTIKASAETFLKQEDKLHVLFNSAGVMAPPLGSKTAQGYELQLGTNVLGHYLFTKLLLPTLEKTAQQLPNQGYNVVRIINTSSNGHVGAPAGGFKFEDPNGINSKWTLYGQSKWCNLVHADELARRYGDKGISAHSLNPGAISTDLQRHSGFFERTLLRPILNPVELGCLTQLYAGLMPEAGKSEHNGTYYIPWGREGIKRPDTQDKEVASKLWDWLDKETAQYA